MIRITRTITTSTAAMVAAFCSSNAAAVSYTTYTSLSAFNIAAGTTQLENFEGSSGSTTIVTSMFTLSSSDSNIFVNTSNAFGTGRFVSANGRSPQTTSIAFAFTQPIYALGFRYTSGSATSLSIPGIGTISGIPVSGFPNLGFFGILSDTAFSSATLRDLNDGLEVENVMTRVTGVSAVPEPASWAMMILGMGAVGGALRRRSKVSTIANFA